MTDDKRSGFSVNCPRLISKAGKPIHRGDENTVWIMNPPLGAWGAEETRGYNQQRRDSNGRVESDAGCAVRLPLVHIWSTLSVMCPVFAQSPLAFYSDLLEAHVSGANTPVPSKLLLSSHI